MCLFILFASILEGQRLHIGIPTTYEPTVGSILILDPLGFYIKRGGSLLEGQLAPLKKIMMENDSFKYKINIHMASFGTDEINYKFSERQAVMVKNNLLQDSIFHNLVDYEVIPKGNKEILFKKEYIRQISAENKKLIQYYEILNNRIEVEVLQKID
jgi:hypothetical protein